MEHTHVLQIFHIMCSFGCGCTSRNVTPGNFVYPWDTSIYITNKRVLNLADVELSAT